MWVRWDPHQVTWRRAGTQDAMCPWHLINPREALPDKSDVATCSAQGFKGPQVEQTASNRLIHREPTLGPTKQSPRRKAVQTEPTRDRPIPQVGRTHLKEVSTHLPRVVSTLDPKGIPVVLGVF
jgi:hypothetical protein